jgi:hypothetical protein
MDKEFPNRKMWKKFIIDSGYSIPQITDAIKSIREDDWDSIKTSDRIALIKKHLKENN